MTNDYESCNPGNLILYEERKRNKYPIKQSMHGSWEWTNTFSNTPSVGLSLAGPKVSAFESRGHHHLCFPRWYRLSRQVLTLEMDQNLIMALDPNQSSIETSRWLLSDSSRALDQSATGEHPSHVGWINPRQGEAVSISGSDFTDIIFKLLWSLAGSLFWVYIHLSQWLFNRIFMWNFNSWIKWV